MYFLKFLNTFLHFGRFRIHISTKENVHIPVKTTLTDSALTFGIPGTRMYFTYFYPLSMKLNCGIVMYSIF